MAQMLIDADTTQLQAAVAQALALPAQARRAAKRALKRLRAHVVTTSKRETATAAKVPQKALSNRYKGEPPDEKGLTIWAGLWDVAPESVSTPRQTGAGVRAGRWFFPGAFYRRVTASRPHIYIRLSSRHYQPGLYPGLRPAGPPSGGYRDFGRFPVIRIRIPIDEPMVASFEGNADEFIRFFGRRFDHELTHEAAVRSAPR